MILTDDEIALIRNALNGAISVMCKDAETIDAEWGRCRFLDELEAQHDLPDAVYDCRQVLTLLDKPEAPRIDVHTPYIQGSFLHWLSTIQVALEGRGFDPMINDIRQEFWKLAHGNLAAQHQAAVENSRLRLLLDKAETGKTVPLAMLKDARLWGIDPIQFSDEWNTIAARYGFKIEEDI